MDGPAPAIANVHVVGRGEDPVVESPHRLEPNVHVGKLGLDHLEFTDRATKLHARLGVFDRQFQGPLANADTDRGNHRAFQIEPAHDDRDTFVLSADQIGGGNAALIEHQFRGLAATEPHLGQLLSHLETGEVLLDNEGGDAVRTLLQSGLGIDQQYICNWSIRDIELRTVQHEFVAIAPGGRAHRPERVGARAWFRQTQSANAFSGT